MYTVMYHEDWWLPNRMGFSQQVRLPLDDDRSLLVTLFCSQWAPQPTVEDAGIYVAGESPDGPYWKLVERVAPTRITLATPVTNSLLERAVA